MNFNYMVDTLSLRCKKIDIKNINDNKCFCSKLLKFDDNKNQPSLLYCKILNIRFQSFNNSKTLCNSVKEQTLLYHGQKYSLVYCSGTVKHH